MFDSGEKSLDVMAHEALACPSPKVRANCGTFAIFLSCSSLLHTANCNGSYGPNPRFLVVPHVLRQGDFVVTQHWKVESITSGTKRTQLILQGFGSCANLLEFHCWPYFDLLLERLW